ncbi:MAG: hypothetical protein DRQ02_09435 [Candidatus Latescibacterota bacterium]|nr:MAG: hypothetical protein DRQ02_09435 [Candidatus Latescibacterota bacterium]
METRWAIDGEPSIGFIAENTRSILHENRIENRGNIGTVYAFKPGGVYRSLWIDDMSAALPTLIYFVEGKYVTTFLVEHFWRQQSDGSLPMILREEDLGGKEQADVVMYTANQLGVMNLWRIYRATGDLEFLQQDIRGTPLIGRADHALSFIRKHRWDEKHGLMKNIYVMDWGDVETKKGRVEDNNGLWQNSMLALAADRLAQMWQALGNDERAEYWERAAGAIRTHINQYLWQESRGFYRPRIPATDSETIYDDSGIFVLGGNTLAVQAGVADQEQMDRIFAHAEECRIADGGPTISRVNYPDYPGIWRYEPMNHPPYYQNGDYWNWHGGRFVRTEFEHGHAAEAWEHLLQITRHQARFQAFEFYKRDGSNGNPGVLRYTPSTCLVAEAIIYGLFGIYESADSVVIQPRLGDRDGWIDLYSPLTGRFVNYSYSFSEGDIEIEYGTNCKGCSGEMKVLLPVGRKHRSVLVNSKERAFKLETVGNDVYVAFDIELPSGRVKIRLR